LFENAILAVDFSSKSVDEQYEEFRLLDMLTKSEEHEQRLYNSKTIKQLNRYTDILTFKDTRVVLKQAKETDYINACFVDVSLS
jgi:protein tyrosine phosphatase